MERIENHCVGCPKEMGCLGSACSVRNVKVTYCGVCGEEICDEIYNVDEEDLCKECFAEYLVESYKDKYKKGD